jgi:hypothetical protein
MESLLGFQVGFWDYATLIVLTIIGAAGLGVAVFVLGLPGRIAIARNHPEAEAASARVFDGAVPLRSPSAIAQMPN